MNRTLRRSSAVGLAGLVLSVGCGSTPDGIGVEPVDRVLIVALPGVGWEDVENEDLPTLEAFVDSAAIGDMSTRIGRRNATAADAYLTIGAGTRAVAPSVDRGVAVDPGDQYGGVATAEILERRLGYVPDGIAYLASGSARDVNERSAFGAEVGLLGEVLDDAGIARGVIANADAVEGFASDDQPPDGYYQRSAATALMTPNGIVPHGTVGRSLLMDDPHAAFGRRMAPDAVLEAFDDVWDEPGRQVVLVEASDIARAAGYGGRSTTAQRRALRSEALAGADALLARLLERIDPERDAVLVLSPVSPNVTPELGMVALRGPDVEVGFLQSATTRRDGYVHLADVAPTVLELMGEEFPTQMEGRSFQVGDRAGDSRMSTLVASAEAAAFRDAYLPAVVAALSLIIVGLAAATVWRDRLSPRSRAVASAVAFGVLGAVPGLFLAGQVGAAHDSVVGHGMVVAAVAAALAAAAMAVERLRPGLGIIAAPAATVVLITGDVLTGAHLQMNTMFGYSMAVAGRFTGLGNLAYALYGAAAVAVAVLVFERYGRRALAAVAAMLVVVVLVDGLPMLGADVGGVLSLIPAFGVVLLVLAGRRVGWREAALLGVVAAATVLVFAFVDAARPSQTHTHLARLAEHVLEGRWDLLFTNLNRRWQASFGSLQLAGWATIVTALGAAGAYAFLQVRKRSAAGRPANGRRSTTAHPVPAVAMVAGLAVLGTVGLVVNDSSLAVPLTVFIVAVPVVVVRTMNEAEVPVVPAGDVGRRGVERARR